MAGNKHVNIVNQITKGVEDFKLQDYINMSTEGLFNVAEDLLSKLNLPFSLSELLNLSNLDLMGLIRKVLDYFGLGWLLDLFLDLKNLFDAIVRAIGRILSALGSIITDRLDLLNALNIRCTGAGSAWDGNGTPPFFMRKIILASLFTMLSCYGVRGPFSEMLDKVDPLTEYVITPGMTDANGVYIPEVIGTRRHGNFNDDLRRGLIPSLGHPDNTSGISQVIDIAGHSFTAVLGPRDIIGGNVIDAVNADTEERITSKTFDDVYNAISHMSGGTPSTHVLIKGNETVPDADQQTGTDMLNSGSAGRRAGARVKRQDTRFKEMATIKVKSRQASFDKNSNVCAGGLPQDVLVQILS